jgi:hypothetical protein
MTRISFAGVHAMSGLKRTREQNRPEPPSAIQEVIRGDRPNHDPEWETGAHGHDLRLVEPPGLLPARAAIVPAQGSLSGPKLSLRIILPAKRDHHDRAGSGGGLGACEVNQLSEESATHRGAASCSMPAPRFSTYPARLSRSCRAIAMVGFRDADGTFVVLWFDRNFRLYDHS